VSHLTLPKPGPKPTGYSVLRVGAGASSQFCVATAHVEVPQRAVFNRGAGTLELDFGGAQVLLSALPSDLVEAIRADASRVMVVSVDTLARARSSSRLSDLIQ
jgi:hypothetical protein